MLVGLVRENFAPADCLNLRRGVHKKGDTHTFKRRVEFKLGVANVSAVPFDTIFYFIFYRGRRTSLISFSHNWAAVGLRKIVVYAERHFD